MTILESYSIYALLISNVMLLGAATLAILGFQRKLKNSSRFWDSPTGSALQAQCDQSRYNQETEERLSLLQDAVDRIEQHSGDVQAIPDKLPFDNAVRMAKAGASLDDLVRTCGLGHSEARLLIRIHARSAA